MTKGQRIRNARKKAGMTQTELAQKLNIPFQSISQWERDLRKPKFDTIERIAKVLRVSPAYLMGWEDDFGELDLGLMEIEMGKQLNVPKESASMIVHATAVSVLGQKTTGPEIFSKISDSVYKLNPAGQKKVSDYAEDLTKIPEYQAKISAEDE